LLRGLRACRRCLPKPGRDRYTGEEKLEKNRLDVWKRTSPSPRTATKLQPSHFCGYQVNATAMSVLGSSGNRAPDLSALFPRLTGRAHADRSRRRAKCPEFRVRAIPLKRPGRQSGLAKGVSAAEVVATVEVVAAVTRAEVKFERVKVIVVMMTVHCHRGGRQHKQECGRSNQSEFRHGRSPFMADIGASFAITNKMRFRNKCVLEISNGMIDARAVIIVAKRLRQPGSRSIVAVADRCTGFAATLAKCRIVECWNAWWSFCGWI
jgi:hypothetical protein